MRTHKINNLYFEYGHLLPYDEPTGVDIAQALKAAGLIMIIETDGSGEWVRYAELAALYKSADKQAVARPVLERVKAPGEVSLAAHWFSERKR